MELSEQEIIRRQSLQEIINLGIDPYPAEAFEVNTTTREITDRFGNDPGSFQDVSIGGRIMSR